MEGIVLREYYPNSQPLSYYALAPSKFKKLDAFIALRPRPFFVIQAALPNITCFTSLKRVLDRIINIWGSQFDDSDRN
jgi:hypothetical protein